VSVAAGPAAHPSGDWRRCIGPLGGRFGSVRPDHAGGCPCREAFVAGPPPGRRAKAAGVGDPPSGRM